MTSANNDSAEELAELMKQLSAQNGLLRSHLLNDAVIRHRTYSIKRERDVFTPLKYDSLENAIASLFVVLSSDPLNTKEAELFPGFIQVTEASFAQALKLTEAVNIARAKVKSFLVKHKKKKRITTDTGVVFTQNPLLYTYDPMINTMQVYRHLSAIHITPVKSSFIWQSNKRYLKYDKNKALNIILNAKASPAPLNIDHKLWANDLDNAYALIERLKDTQTITRICSTEPKPHFKYKVASQKHWDTHYGATPLIIACDDDTLFPVNKPMQSINVTNKHKMLPVTGTWKPLSQYLDLYY